MKKLIITLLLTLIASTAQPYERSIKAEWIKYVGPTDATVAGFQLYQDGAKVCTFTGKDIVSGECKVNITKLATNFTLSALFVGGKESPHSQVYVLQDAGQEPQGLKITVVTVQTVSYLSKYGNPIAKTTIKRKEVDAGTVVKEGATSYRNRRGDYVTNTTVVIN